MFSCFSFLFYKVVAAGGLILLPGGTVAPSQFQLRLDFRFSKQLCVYIKLDFSPIFLSCQHFTEFLCQAQWSTHLMIFTQAAASVNYQCKNVMWKNTSISLLKCPTKSVYKCWGKRFALSGLLLWKITTFRNKQEMLFNSPIQEKIVAKIISEKKPNIHHQKGNNS